MAEVARGQITDRPFVRTIYTVAARRFSGDLRIERETGRCALAWHRGAVVAADVPGADGSLGERAAAVFAVTDGTFVLDDASQLTSTPGDEPVDPRWLIFHGVLAHYDNGRLERELAALSTRRFGIARDALPGLEAYGLDGADDAWIKRLLERTWTLPELAGTDPDADRRRLAVLIYALLATDALDLADGSGDGDAVARSMKMPAATPAAAATRPARTTARPKPASVDARDAGVRDAGVRDADELRRIISDRVQLIAAKADHYRFLGVARDAGVDEIRAAYFTLAKQLHPDRVRQLSLAELGPHASQVFARINEAFGALGDAAKRAQYDTDLASGGADGDGELDAETEAKMLAILEAEEKFQLGEMALRRAHYSQALEDFGAAVELNPEEGEHHAMFGWARWMDARDKDSVIAEVKRRFRAGLRLSPNNPAIFFYRGKLALALDDDESALFCFSRTLELDPEHEPAFKQKRLLENAIAAKQPKRSKRLTLGGRAKRETSARANE